MPTAGAPAVLVALEAVPPSDKSYKLYNNVSTLPHHYRQGFLCPPSARVKSKWHLVF